MTGLVILWVTLVFSTLFLLFNIEGEYSYFPFSEMNLNPQLYVYYLFEHVNQILVPVGVYLARKHTRALIVFVCIQFIDAIDYTLFYSNPWFDGPPTFNHLKVGVFGLTILYERYGR
jgi:hypothetical protein